ncbi:MAG: ATP-binding protein [Pseudomonadota bacterium]|nr:ATP-binding protein [Pseudomonadota bacterium]
MRSIRVFLVVATLATLVLVVFVAAVQGYRSSMGEAESLFDSQLQELAQFAVNLRGEHAPGNSQPTHIAYQLWQPGAEGGATLLAHSANTPASPLTGFAPGFGYVNFHGYRWRTYVHLAEADNLVAVVAARTDVRFQLAENVILEAILPIVVGLPLSALLIWLIVGRGLGPLRELAERLREKEYRDLSPVRIAEHPRELDQVLNSVNGLLARLNASFERERRFASDAAHELRTPISVLKLQLHNLQQAHPDRAGELRDLQAGVQRMQHLVEQILALYRSTPEQYSAGLKPLNLHELVAGLIAERYGDFEARGQTVELRGASTGTTVAGDPFALHTLVTNLLANANRYTPDGGTILATVESGPGTVVLRIEDNGPGIPEQERERIFERFHRIGGDRHDSGQPGCGLGLAIVRNIADLHGATIAVTPSRFASGACFTLTFPAAPPANSRNETP